MRNIGNSSLSTICPDHDPVMLDDDFLILEHPDLYGLLGEEITSKYSIICICNQGEMEYFANQRKSILSKDEVSFLIKDQTYCLHSVSPGFNASIVLLSESFLNWLDVERELFFWRYSGEIIKSTPHGSLNRFIEMCKDIIHMDTNPEKKTVIQLLTKAYIIGLSHFMVSDASLSEAQNASHVIVRRFLKLLRPGQIKCRHPKYYAEAICVSEKHLSFVCKQVLGHSALSLINQSIIIESEQLLAKTSMSITEIAEKLGFSNIGVFGRFFKRHVGLSPREYRTKGNGCA